ncbi:MAG: hypothetical protein PF503_23650 [Desulfobacula sp.]|jgi:hypothetical protein|nr:hypothetical protein [Desulfobacula sp.]
MKQKLDNRMEWIRNAEKLNIKSTSTYSAEYELASESYIPGVLDFENGSILCGVMTFNKDPKGYYKYLLKIKYPYNDETFRVQDANKKGYLFKGGIPGELIALFSLFFQCRFFLLSAYSGELSSTSIKLKSEYSPQLGFCKPHFDPDTFPDGKRNFSIDLGDFLNKLQQIDTSYHQDIILGSYNYSRALKEFGIDEEMVFIRLVSAIESFSKWVKLTEKDDLFKGIDLNDILKTNIFSEKDRSELESIFNVRKTKAKFKAFVELYSKGFFKGGNFKASHMRIKKSELPTALNAIYDGRSGYLHRGEVLYLSRPIRGGQKWDTDPTVGMIMGNRQFSAKMKLPYSSWFQRLVRHCIMQFIAGQSNK